MDILDHLLEHDAQATRHQIDFCRHLTEAQWRHTFDFGQGSLYKTFDHLVDSKEYWTSLMLGQPSPFSPAPPDPTYSLEIIAHRFEAVSKLFTAVSRQKQQENRLGEMFLDTETGPAYRTYGACIVHITTHSMHHRAQVLVMLDLLGVDYDPFVGFALDWFPLVSETSANSEI